MATSGCGAGEYTPNTEARDALLSSGMEDEMTEGYEKLDALLKSL